jgi:hypothetical protein
MRRGRGGAEEERDDKEEGRNEQEEDRRDENETEERDDESTDGESRPTAANRNQRQQIEPTTSQPTANQD